MPTVDEILDGWQADATTKAPPASSSSRREAEPEIEQFKNCPYCAERIRRNAVKCKHCGSVLRSSVPENSVVVVQPPPPQTDGPGVISLICGVMAFFVVVVGCLLFSIYGAITYPVTFVFACGGLITGFYAKGNLRVAGIFLNILAAIPAIVALIVLMMGIAMAKVAQMAEFFRSLPIPRTPVALWSAIAGVLATSILVVLIAVFGFSKVWHWLTIIPKRFDAQLHTIIGMENVIIYRFVQAVLYVALPCALAFFAILCVGSQNPVQQRDQQVSLNAPDETIRTTNLADSRMFYTAEKVGDVRVNVIVHDTPLGDVKSALFIADRQANGTKRFHAGKEQSNAIITIEYGNGEVTSVKWDGREVRAEKDSK